MTATLHPFIHVTSSGELIWQAECDRCHRTSPTATYGTTLRWVSGHLRDWHGGVDRHDD